MILYLVLFFYFPENLILIFSCYFIHCICTAFGLNIMDSILGIFLLISFGWWLTFLNGGKFCLIPVIRQFSMLLPIIFFFWETCWKFLLRGQKTSVKYYKIGCITDSQWMSSNHIWGSYKNFANLASLSTTVLPLHLTCEKEAFPKFEVRSRKSSIMWPKAARQGESDMRCLYITSKSPSNTTSCRPILMAKGMVLLQANASKSSTVGGKPMHSDRASITKSSELRTTTPRPAEDVSWKIAPSQLALYWDGGGGSQWVV